MKYDFDEKVERRGTGSVKWDAGDYLTDFEEVARKPENKLFMRPV